MLDFSRFSKTSAVPDSSDSDPRIRLRALIERTEKNKHPQPQDVSRPGVAKRWLPSAWQQSRIDPGRLGVIGLVLAGLGAITVIVFGVWADRPEDAPVAPPPLPISLPTSTSTAPPMVISVVGQVAKPGLVTIPAGQRVADALNAAGGPLPDTDVTTLNLARKLTDGEQLYVGIPAPAGQSMGEVSAGQSAGSGAGRKVNLNSATKQQLDELPGVGEVTSERIVRWRAEHGRFTSVEQLREVDGIGDTRFSRLRELVRV